jgi:C4-dicarboxylate-specific signal transduction histidine kinase
VEADTSTVPVPSRERRAAQEPEVTTAAAREDAVGKTPARRLLGLGQWLFLLLAVFLVVPLCVTNLWGYFQLRRALTALTFQDVRNVASLEASRVMLYVQNAEDLFVSTLSADRHLAALARSLNTADTNARRQAREELRAVQNKMSGITPVEDIQLVSATGTLLLSTLDEDGAGPRVATPDCVQPRTDGPQIVGVAPPGQAPSLLVAAALTDDQGERVGTLCARFRFDIHEQLLRAHQVRTSRGMLYLLNNRGEIVDESSASRPSGEHQVFRRNDRLLPDLQHPWEGRYVLESGAAALAAYAPIPQLGWGVVVEVPITHALATLRRLERQAAIAAVALALIVLAAAVWSWRTLVYPLRSLSRAAERMAAGATGERVAPGGPREVAELATAFNTMSVALCESQHTLEQRITERTRELRESREFAELLLNSINHRVIVVDRNYHIVKANVAAVRMYGPGLVGRPCYALEGRSGPCEECAAARTFATGRVASEERAQQTGDGREAVEVETYPVFGANGQVESVIEIGRIVSAEKQLQMQMMHQEKMAAFGLLAAGVAHDIGNPLAAIESQLQLARQQPHRQDETFAVVSKEVARISRMLRELIDFARRRRDTVTLVSANQVVEDVMRVLGHDPRSRTIAIAHRLAAKLPGIRTTEDHLFQVLFNLGLNALDAMADGGTLEFETSVRSGWVIVRVRDTGSGIPANLHEHLFEPFFTTKAPERGTGLGLFVSKSIVESMGGELTLEHTDGRGSVFALFLPVDAGAESGVSV